MSALPLPKPGDIVWAVVNPTHNDGDPFAPALLVETGDSADHDGITGRAVVFQSPAVGQILPQLVTLTVYPDRATARTWGGVPDQTTSAASAT